MCTCVCVGGGGCEKDTWAARVLPKWAGQRGAFPVVGMYVNCMDESKRNPRVTFNSLVTIISLAIRFFCSHNCCRKLWSKGSGQVLVKALLFSCANASTRSDKDFKKSWLSEADTPPWFPTSWACTACTRTRLLVDLRYRIPKTCTCGPSVPDPKNVSLWIIGTESQKCVLVDHRYRIPKTCLCGPSVPIPKTCPCGPLVPNPKNVLVPAALIPPSLLKTTSHGKYFTFTINYISTCQLQWAHHSERSDVS